MPQVLARLANRLVPAGRRVIVEALRGLERHKAEDLSRATAGARDREARVAGLRAKPSDLSTFSQDSRLLIC